MNRLTDIWRRVEGLTGVADFGAWFGNERPVEIEIGCGKGRFLAESAVARPAVNFIGVEKEGKYLRRARQRIEKAGLPNIRLIHGDMVLFMLHNVPDASIQAIHIYFPDPWPKRRHKKRRMFRDVSVEQFHRALAPDGRLIIKTDVPVNFTRMRRATNDSGLFDLEEMAKWPCADPPPDNVATSFEIKYGPIGKQVHYARWKRR